MKKIYLLLASVLYGFTAMAAEEANGTISYQIDMNNGTTETPDLTDEITDEVTGTYEDGILSIDLSNALGLLPMEFTIDLQTGDALAEEQVAIDYDGDLLYYYDIESEEQVLVGKIFNIGTDKCQLELQPWGMGTYYSGVGLFFDLVAYNTVFTFDFAIPGLEAEVAAPVLEIASVDYEAVASDYGMYMDFTVAVTAEDLPEGSEVTVYYKGPNDNDFKTAAENTDGTYGFSIYSLEEDKEYTVEIYAQAGSLTSESEIVSFKFEFSGIDSISGNDSTTRFFDLKGVEVRNLQPGEMYIKVNKGNAKKVLIK